MTKAERRCPWCLGSPEYVAYHDREWGRPVHDDRVLFEFLVLEGAQAGGVGRRDVDGVGVGGGAEALHEPAVVVTGLLQRRGFVLAKVDAQHGAAKRGPGGLQAGQHGRRAFTGEAHAVDEG